MVSENNEDAAEQLDIFIELFKESPFKEYRDFGNTLRNWKTEILNSFIRINGKRMSNGPLENLNGRINKIISQGYGYSNFNRFRKRAMYSLNKDESIKIY